MADRQIRAIIQGLNRLTERVITKITLDVDANLRETTPIDLGWARANWVPAIGTPFRTDLEGIKPTIAQAAAQAAEQAQAMAAVVAGYRLTMGKVFISNNVPYITRLNDGSSTQEPPGFVQRAIHKAVTQDIRGFRP